MSGECCDKMTAVTVYTGGRNRDYTGTEWREVAVYKRIFFCKCQRREVDVRCAPANSSVRRCNKGIGIAEELRDNLLADLLPP